VKDYGLDNRAIEVRSPAEARVFSSSLCVQTALSPTQPPVQWAKGVLYPGVKRGRDVTPVEPEFGLKSHLSHRINSKEIRFKPSSFRNQMRRVTTTQHQPDQQVTVWVLSVCNSVNLVIHRTMHTPLLHLHLISVLADTSDKDDLVYMILC
jgi:hypothetical protein